jgi:hypothetical protein
MVLAILLVSRTFGAACALPRGVARYRRKNRARLSFSDRSLPLARSRENSLSTTTDRGGELILRRRLEVGGTRHKATANWRAKACRCVAKPPKEAPGLIYPGSALDSCRTSHYSAQ